MHSRSMLLTVAAASITLVNADTPFEVPSNSAICYSYGVDFVDEGQYFIDSTSTENFTTVSYFQGCNKDGVTDVMLVAPENTTGEAEFLCDQIPTTPDNQNQLSTCPIKKNQMSSGHWILLILGDNGDNADGTPGQLFAWQRDLYLTVGTKVNCTATPTVTGTMTVTATYTTPGHVGKPDKPCEYSPTMLHPAALVTPTTLPTIHRFFRKGDREVDYKWARARIEAAKQRRAEKAGQLERRAPDDYCH